jgi:ankyrin repeat protein
MNFLLPPYTCFATLLTQWNKTPLHIAKFGEWPGVGVAEESQAPTISLLEQHGATLVVASAPYFTSRSHIPLHQAVRSNNIVLVRPHLDMREPVNKRDTDGSTTLHHAVEGSKSLEITALLLERGADPNVRGATDGYPLSTCL